MCVLSATRRDLAQVISESSLKDVEGVGSVYAYGAKMRNIEYGCARTARGVFNQSARGVRERHLPVTEGNHLGP